MFHRVKSETVPEEKAAPEAAEEQKEQAPPKDVEAQVPEAKTGQQTTQPETEKKTQEQTAERKDNQMTNPNQPKEKAAAEEKPAQEKARPDIPAGTYAQSTQSAGRPGGYPGAYPGVSYGSQGKAEPVEHSDRTLTIGPGITMSGEIESCDNLVVEGTVEAALKGARNLNITESGTFYGTVEIEEAIIAGRFEGELTVNGRLVVRTGGMITGTIAYGELEIEAGAIIDGRLTPVTAVPAQEEAAPQAAPAPKVKPAPAPKAKVEEKDERPEPANEEGALFAAEA